MKRLSAAKTRSSLVLTSTPSVTEGLQKSEYGLDPNIIGALVVRFAAEDGLLTDAGVGKRECGQVMLVSVRVHTYNWLTLQVLIHVLAAHCQTIQEARSNSRLNKKFVCYAEQLIFQANNRTLERHLITKISDSIQSLVQLPSWY